MSAPNLTTKEQLQQYLAGAELQEVLRQTLGSILQRETLPSTEKLVGILGAEHRSLDHIVMFAALFVCFCFLFSLFCVILRFSFCNLLVFFVVFVFCFFVMFAS